MAARKKTARTTRIPSEALDHLYAELEAFGDPALDAYRHGRFAYVTHGADPLCRLAWRGTVDEWDFAIYRFSTGRYSNDVFGMPSHASVADCVRCALSAYNLL